MKIAKIVEELSLEIVAGYNKNGDDSEAEGVYICDLLSLVMSKSHSKNIWVTIQTHVNIIAVASLVELSGVIVAEGLEIDQETIVKANDVNVPLFKSSLSAYELASKLNELGV